MEIRVLKATTLLVILSIFLLLFDTLVNLWGNTVINSALVFGYTGGNTIALVISVIFLLAMGMLWKWHSFDGPGVVMIIAGGLVNSSERVIYGGVIDYFHLFGFYFNLPDVFIFVGLTMLVYNEISKLLDKKTANL
ncbi:MAG: signal peptidase II [Candidatus Berkelbacteria bacterium]